MIFFQSKSMLTRLLMLLVILVSPLFSEGIFSDLIISEVFLNREKQEISWFEVYNPTEENIYLQTIALSNVKTPNILPQRNNKGVLCQPQEVVIFCANKELFLNNYKNVKSQCIEVPALKIFSLDGGFFGISTSKKTETTGNIIRYGRSLKSERIKIITDEVIDYSDKNSFSRRFTKTKNGYLLENFEESKSSPGLVE